MASTPARRRGAGGGARGAAPPRRLFGAVLAMGGSLTGEHGVGQVKVGYLEEQLGAGTLALMGRLKAALDPAGRLNPGKKLAAALPIAARDVPVAATRH